MTLNFEEEGDVQLPLACESLAGRVMLEALDYIGCPYEAEVSLLLTSNEEIHGLNLQYRGIDRPTDVLSFPQTDYEAPADFPQAEEEADAFNPDTGELFLGDIIISLDKVKEQAESYGHGVKREFAFLVAHSMLHLLGYDHMTEEEAADMEARQSAVLRHLGMER